MKNINEIKKAQAEAKALRKAINQMIDNGTITTTEEIENLWNLFKEEKGIS